ncbi:unnamed protein product [Cunninghamella blakesleeana]
MVEAQSLANLTTQLKGTTGEVPPPLVGASITNVGNHVYVFGGKKTTTTTKDPIKKMTNNMYILNLETLEWQQHISSPDSEKPPSPRYFHSATAFRGQDVNNDTVLEFNILNLITFDWIHGGTMNTPCGIYRTVPFEPSLSHLNLQLVNNKKSSSSESPPINLNSPISRHSSSHSSESSSSSSSSLSIWNKNDIYLFSNYNFTSNTKRELLSFNPSQPTTSQDYIKDHSSILFEGVHHQLNHQKGFTPTDLLPPGLRFPHGEVIGQYLLLSGTFLNSNQSSQQEIQSHSIHLWAFHLLNHTWTKIDTGTKLLNGSWNRGIHYKNQWYLFGNKDRELSMDYNQRQMNFQHVAIIQLEAFGVYQSPLMTYDHLGYELGLSMLNEPNMADVYIITSDQQCIAANSHILCLRWPLAAKLFSNDQQQKDENHPSSSPLKENKKSQTKYQRGIHKSLLFPENYSVALAFLQFIYTDHLLTAQQLQPNILSRLLVLADMYDITRLKKLALHSLHQVLNLSTASLVYEAATLTNQAPLQIRALRVMMNAKRMLDRSHHPHHPQQTISHPINIRSSGPSSSKMGLPPPSPAPTYNIPHLPPPSNTPYLLQDQDHFITSTFMPTSPPPLSTHHYQNYPSSSSHQQQHQGLDKRFSVATASTTNSTNHPKLKSRKSYASSASSSSSSSSIDESSTPRTPHGSFSKENKESNGKFNWRRLQQSTVALAKPKPLRSNAIGHQPFSDL